MSEIFLDDRPLQPNKQYLEQKELQYKQKKELHEYLKKHQFNDQVLPCFRQKIHHTKRQNSSSSTQKKTKAEIYAEIKQKNIEKFGEKKDRKLQKQNENQKKKIDPLKMTINYKPKSAIVIDTNEYKLKSPNQEDQNNQHQAKNIPQHVSTKFEQTAKDKYEKLLNLMRKEKLELTKDKENFQKHKEKLEFKKFIEKQDNVPFISEIKQNIKEKNKLKQSHRVECKAKKENEQSVQKIQNSRKKSTSNQKDQKSQNQKSNLNEIQSKISQLEQQKEEIEDEVYRNKRQLIDPNDVVEKKYPLEQVNQLPAFDVECFKDFVDIRTLHPHGNEFYQIAIKVFETGLNAKEAKMKLKIENIDCIKQNSENIMDAVDFRRRFQGPIRITKYNNGWTEVWNPGVQRLMANKQLGYKVVWLKNGDIKQEWKDRKLESYYSKSKEVVQIKFNKLSPIYYFVQLHQIEQCSVEKKIKTVMFREGRIETFSTEDDTMNGFAV